MVPARSMAWAMPASTEASLSTSISMISSGKSSLRARVRNELAASALDVSALRIVAITWKPLLARVVALTRPKPDEAPVMSATGRPLAWRVSAAEAADAAEAMTPKVMGMAPSAATKERRAMECVARFLVGSAMDTLRLTVLPSLGRSGCRAGAPSLDSVK